MKTLGVKVLVEQALDTLPKPFDKHVIEAVFLAIERNPEWLRTYTDLTVDLGKSVVNSAVGAWVARHVGRSGAQQVVSTKSKLAGSYSLLTFPLVARDGRRKEADALNILWQYFDANRSNLPKDIRKYRQTILDLLLEGLSPEDAFAPLKSIGA